MRVLFKWEQQHQHAATHCSNTTSSSNIIQATTSKETTSVDSNSSSSNDDDDKMDRSCHEDYKHSIEPSPKRNVGGGLGGLGRTKSLFSMTNCSFVSSTSSLGSSSCTSQDEKEEQHHHHEQLLHHPQQIINDDDSSLDENDHHHHHHILLNGSFAMDVQVYTGLGRPVFDHGLRKVMEPYLRKARCEREQARQQQHHALPCNTSNNFYHVDASIANSVGVPYTCLRHELPFLFNEHTFPLHTILAQALGLADLSRLHENMNEADVTDLLKPLLDRERRRSFHLAYHNFVTSFCIPLLHSLAISKKLLHAASASCDYVTYRYQAFPRISISQPGSAGSHQQQGAGAAGGPNCAMARGHAVGCLFFHVPLTPSLDTAALHVESHPGREDWHALEAKSVGLGYLYDGARCLQFETTNTTPSTRVSMEFSVLIYRESSLQQHQQQHQQRHQPKEDLCALDTLEDSFSRAGPGYYEEAVIDLTRNFYPAGCMDAVHRKNKSLVDPDYRVGPPFIR